MSSLLKKMFRPRFIFKEIYVDISLSLSNTFYVLLSMILLYVMELVILKQIIFGIGFGIFIGILVITGEIIWQKHKKRIGGELQISYVLFNIKYFFYFCLFFCSNENYRILAVFGLIGYGFLILFGLLIYQMICKKRFKWEELFPDEN